MRSAFVRDVGVLRLQILLLVIFGLSLLGVLFAPSAQANQSVAYAWQAPVPAQANIVPLHRIDLSGLDTPQALEAAVQAAKVATEAMPNGQRALLNLDLAALLSSDPEDQLRDASGNVLGYSNASGQFTPYRSIWWDNGIAAVQAKVNAFFQRYLEIGGQLDLLSLDLGIDLSNSELTALGESYGDAQAYYAAIAADPRFADIAAQLSFADILDVWRADAVLGRHLEWNALMAERVAAAINAAVYEPLKALLPNVRLSNADFFAADSNFSVPDSAGDFSLHSLVGTHQSRRLFGQIGLVGLRSLDGVNLYTPAPFNALRLEVNRLRAMQLASDAALHPFVADKAAFSSTADQGLTWGWLSGSDLYQELLLHAGLTGASEFLYWNPNASAADDALLSSSLAELDSVLGNGLRLPRVDNLADWGQGYLLSASDAANGRIWRFTPDLQANQPLADTLLLTQPATFLLGSTRISVPNAAVSLQAGVSAQGYWLLEQGGAAPQACQEPLLGRDCSAYYPTADLSGNPNLMVESDHVGGLLRDWGLGGPDAATDRDGFSVAWLTTQNFDAGRYLFSLNADDGVRLWVDGELLIDAWSGNSSSRQLSAESILVSGSHLIRVDYRDDSGAAAVGLDWQRVGCDSPTDIFCVEYFDGSDMSGAAALTTTANSLSFNAADHPNAAAGGELSARWMGSYSFVGGSYLFNLQHSGTARFWIDGVLRYSATGVDLNKSLPIQLAAGLHQITVEYQGPADGYLNLNWETLSNCSVITNGAFCAEYFANSSLTAPATIVQVDAQINNDWGTGAPLAGMPVDQFSVRWQGDFNFDAAEYQFHARTDDGMRVWLDDQLIIDAWKPQGPTDYYAAQNLSAGTHRLKIEYNEYGGGAVAQFNWFKADPCSAVPVGSFCGDYYPARELQGAPIAHRGDAEINFDWNGVAPIAGLDSSNYSVLWQGQHPFEAGNYRFVASADDGMRVWVDDQLIIDKWPSGGSEQFVDLDMSAGLHTIKMAHNQYGGRARAKLDWQQNADCSVVPSGRYCAEYFNTMDLTGAPVRQIYEESINHDWGYGSPQGVNTDGFSARWQGDITFAAAGNYRFTTLTDDGVRLWVDDQLIIDQWRNQAPTERYGTISLGAGVHRIKMEYFENGGGALAQLHWQLLPECSSLLVGSFCGEYFTNVDLVGPPIAVLQENKLEHDWGYGWTLPGMVSGNNVSIRWSGDFQFAEGDYRFVADMDDAVRIWIDGQPLIDSWSGVDYPNHWLWSTPWRHERRAVRHVSAGLHHVVVEYKRVNGYGKANFHWQPVETCANMTATNVYCAEFYNDADLAGDLVDIRRDTAIDFDWVGDAPNPGIHRDGFSSRWSGNYEFAAGTYRFIAEADDGMRVWIDDQPLFDLWSWNSNNHYGTEQHTIRTLSAGLHKLRVEQTDVGGNAKAKFRWEAVDGCDNVPQGQFCGEFYNNTDLSGFPVDISRDAAIDFIWPNGTRPMPGMVWDNFSARWVGDFEFAEGDYRFTSLADDEIRLWIDGVLVLEGVNDWHFADRERRLIQHLSAGVHRLQVEYKEFWGNSEVHLDWQPVNNCGSVPVGQFCAEFYNSDQLTGPIADIRLDSELNFDWSGGLALNPGVHRYNGGARWVGDFDFAAGSYRFSSLGDDGVKVWLDDELIMDGWTNWSDRNTERRAVRSIEGRHRIKVEYQQFGGNAKLNLGWQPIQGCETIPSGSYCVEYYGDRDLGVSGGGLVDVGSDLLIDFNWGSGIPHTGVSRDNFSIRWQGDIDFAEGEYTFTTTSDDGVRLWIDNQLVIDKWLYQGSTSYSHSLYLSAGPHRIKMEYFEGGGGAVAQLFNVADVTGQPLAVANLQLAALSQEAVTLNWTPQGLATHFKVLRDGVEIATVNGGEFIDNDVLPATLYSYQVVASWPSGTDSAPVELAVKVPDTDLPSTPANLRVTSLESGAINLAWEVANDNVAVSSYQLWRNGVKIASLNGTRYRDSGLQDAQAYSYQVSALDSSGNRSLLSPALTVMSSDTIAPSVATALNASQVGSSSVSLNWTAASDNVAVVRYQILRNGVVVGVSDTTSFDDSALADSSRYDYAVIALDGVGNASAASAVLTVTTLDGTPPGAPAGLSAELIGGVVNLSWQPASDNVGVSGYRLIRDGRQLASTALTRYSDHAVEAGASYQYSVKAVDAAGNLSAAGDFSTVTTNGLCAANQSYYDAQLASRMSVCQSCHAAGGLAANTRLLLTDGIDADVRNLATLQALNTAMGSQALLDKTIGLPSHIGGAPFVDANSADYQALAEMLRRLDDPAACDSPLAAANEPFVEAEALAGSCMACHGTDGASGGPSTPSIAGMDRDYFVKVMSDYQSGARAGSIMDRVARGYSSAQIRRMADYFAAKPLAVANQSVDPALVTLGSEIHLAECESCHNNGGRSTNLSGARLAGHWHDYLQATLADYLAGDSQAVSLMQQKLEGLTSRYGAAALAALQAYYASQVADQQQPDGATDLALAATTADSVTLTWMDAADNWGIAYYEIYRDGTLLATTEFNSFTDTNLLPGSYQYQVVAVDASGNRTLQVAQLDAALQSQAAPAGIALLDEQATLRKASLLMLGRTPTLEEMSAVDSEEALRATLRSMMAGSALDEFSFFSASERFLGQGASGVDSRDFPLINTLASADRNSVHDFVKHQPSHLASYLVRSERPWSEILSADYTVVNPLTAQVLEAELLEPFVDPSDANEVRPARLPKLSVRFPDQAFPHAGVLNMSAWLSRFPTTESNRNRHRTNNLFKQFLGMDLETLGQRPLDDSNNGDFEVPTLENPACVACHILMDPIAGAFQNWGTGNRYQQNFNGSSGDLDSLPWTYKSVHLSQADRSGMPWYRPDDKWFRDMFAPGFAGKALPGGVRGFAVDQPYTANLLTNPGAESGLDGWTLERGLALVPSAGECGVTATAKHGNGFFMLGGCDPKVSYSRVYQDVDISDYAAKIDASLITAAYGAYMRTAEGLDRPYVYLDYLDAQGGRLSGSAWRQNRTAEWTHIAYRQTLPVGTRTIRFWLDGRRDVGDSSDAYFDDIYLQLSWPSEGSVAVDSSAQDNLQWLAQELVKDPRFAKGAVHFWYRALFKRPALTAPVDASAVDFDTRMVAFNEQDQLFDELARQFSVDRGHGAFNVKDLLIDLVMSPWFRADSAAGLSAERKAELADIGLARLLTPQELEHKLGDLTGDSWWRFQGRNAWYQQFGRFYGGFDGGRDFVEPNSEMNSLMVNIPERMALELSCNTVRREFWTPIADRKLFKFVDQADTPEWDEIDYRDNLLINAGAEQGMLGWTIVEGSVVAEDSSITCGNPGAVEGDAYFSVGGSCSDRLAAAEAYQEVDLNARAAQIDAGGMLARFGAELRDWSRSDIAEIFVSFIDANGNEIGRSDSLSYAWNSWQQHASYAAIPAGARKVRLHMRGTRVAGNANDTYVDATYLGVTASAEKPITTGELRIRQNLQYLHQQLLGEELALDDPELDRSFNLFKEVWSDPESDISGVNCQLNTTREDPYRSKRAWAMVMIYLLGDARFLYE